MATRKQLAALKKARAALKKKRKAKKVRKKRPVKRVAKKRTVKRAVKKRSRKAAPKRAAKKRRAKRERKDYGTNIYARKGLKGKRYYLQKVKGDWNFSPKKPRGFTGKELRHAKVAAKKLVKHLPVGYQVYINAKKKR